MLGKVEEGKIVVADVKAQTAQTPEAPKSPEVKKPTEVKPVPKAAKKPAKK